MIFATLVRASLGPVPGLPTQPVDFSFEAPESVSTVHVVGTFNGWDPEADGLTDRDGDGRFEGTLEVPPGRHFYKFVLQNRRWVADLDSDGETRPDGFGGINHVLVVEPPAALKPGGARGDGVIEFSAVSHPRGVPWRVVNRQGWAEVRLLTAGDDLDGVFLISADTSAKMISLGSESPWEVWSSRVPRETLESGYAFRLVDGATQREWPEGDPSPQLFPMAAMETRSGPAWAADAMFYQIFPERFANGNLENDPEGTEPWGSPPDYYKYQGGDLEGVAAHLPYLRELGVNALYLNPIFESPSNHKYDVANYRKIDPSFGGEEAFDALVAKIHASDMHLILDGVFNHTGDGHAAFRDLRRKGRESVFADWYRVHHWPVAAPETPNYDVWGGHGHLPEVRSGNPEVLAHFLGTLEYWAHRGVDGWRLDAAEKVEHAFWRHFRARAKLVMDDPYLWGEIWSDGGPWLDGTQFDGVTNYRFRNACVAFFARETIDAAEFAASLQEILREQSLDTHERMVNFLGTHDTPRWRTVCGGDMARARVGLSFLLAYSGAPLIYYGDEVGLGGGNDPENRGAFDWSTRTWDRVTRNGVRQGIQARRKHGALRRGSVAIRYARGEVLFLEREWAQEALGVLVLRGEVEALPILTTELPDGVWADVLSGQRAVVRDGVLEPGGLENHRVYIFYATHESR